MDRQKIIEALRLCSNTTPVGCPECPYRCKNRVKDRAYCYDVLKADAAELLENEDRHQKVMVYRPSEGGC